MRGALRGPALASLRGPRRAKPSEGGPAGPRLGLAAPPPSNAGGVIGHSAYGEWPILYSKIIEWMYDTSTYLAERNTRLA